MGLDDLQPGNTKRAKATAVKAFDTFLKSEDVDWEYVKGCILSDTSGKAFVSVMDKFGVYLAFHEGKAGKQLARHTCMQYYRQAKHWLLDQFPQHRLALESKLLKMGRTLESFCLKREGGGFVKKAIACTKADLRRMMHYLYSNAFTSSGYQDAALLSLLWYMFGRASDLTHVRKQNVSVDAGDVFFVHFIRMKTNEEQGLSLFADADIATCPLLAIALALATQTAPCADLPSNLPAQAQAVADALDSDTPLLELLDNPECASDILPSSTTTPSTLTTHTHVNRLLDRVAKRAGVEQQLTSHSFRRGGAQHANGSAELTDRWIFDRGAWNVSTTNKAFNYVFNTRAEDHKVAKVLSGWSSTKRVPLADLAPFDTQTREQITAVQERLFAPCRGLGRAQYNVNQRVLDALTAVLLTHYPLLKQMNPNSPAVLRIETSALDSQLTLADLLAWSSHLVAAHATCATDEDMKQAATPQAKTEEQQIIRHQAAVIDHLIGLAKRQDQRLDALEANASVTAQSVRQNKRAAENGETKSSRDEGNSKHRKRASTIHLRDAWYEWYAEEPRLWSMAGKKQRKSDAKMIVAFLKLFLDEGFSLNEQLPSYRDDVVSVGLDAEAKAVAFLDERGIASRGATSVLKKLRVLHRDGALNTLIARYKRLLAAGKIVDPAPRHTQDTLEPVLHTTDK